MLTMTPEYWQQASQDLAQGDPIMAALVERYQGMSLTSRGDAFGTLTRSIVGQQISVKAADAVWSRLSAVVGSVSPEAVLAKGNQVWLAAGFQHARRNILSISPDILPKGAYSQNAGRIWMMNRSSAN